MLSVLALMIGVLRRSRTDFLGFLTDWAVPENISSVLLPTEETLADWYLVSFWPLNKNFLNYLLDIKFKDFLNDLLDLKCKDFLNDLLERTIYRLSNSKIF